jgi:hypothetical protein
MPIAVQGLRDLNRDLIKVGVEAGDLKDVYGAIAAEGAEIAAGFAPRESGALQATIRGNRAKGKAVVTAGRASVRYAGPANYGWPRRNIRGAQFLARADQVMETRAPDLLEAGLATIFEQNGFPQ